MATTTKIKTKEIDYRGVGSVMKWGTLGFFTLALVGGTTYYFINKSNKDKKEDEEFSDTTVVDAKGRSSTNTIGTGKTPSYYATTIHSALKATSYGLPDTDEDQVMKLLRELRTQYEVALVSKSYESAYQIPLAKALEDDLDSDEYQEAIDIVANKPVK